MIKRYKQNYTESQRSNILPQIFVSAFLHKCPDEPLPRLSRENNPLQNMTWTAVI